MIVPFAARLIRTIPNDKVEIIFHPRLIKYPSPLRPQKEAFDSLSTLIDRAEQLEEQVSAIRHYLRKFSGECNHAGNRLPAEESHETASGELFCCA